MSRPLAKEVRFLTRQTGKMWGPTGLGGLWTKEWNLSWWDGRSTGRGSSVGVARRGSVWLGVALRMFHNGKWFAVLVCFLALLKVLFNT